MDTDERDSGRRFVTLSNVVDAVSFVSLLNAFVVVWKCDVVNLCGLQIMIDASLLLNIYLSGFTAQ